MAVISSSNKAMKTLVKQLVAHYPNVSFHQSDTFLWNPKLERVHYDPSDSSKQARWSLLHELAHGLLGHTDYETDIELLLMEAQAWEHAIRLQGMHDTKNPIDNEHVQDCLDTYRDWLYSRSTCPECDQVGLQEDKHRYKCLNCLQIWRVSTKRFTRPYRLCTIEKIKTSSAQTNEQMKFY